MDGLRFWGTGVISLSGDAAPRDIALASLIINGPGRPSPDQSSFVVYDDIY